MIDSTPFTLAQLRMPERWLELSLPVIAKVFAALLIFYLGRFVVRAAVRVLRTVMQLAPSALTCTVGSGSFSTFGWTCIDATSATVRPARRSGSNAGVESGGRSLAA